MSYPVNYKTLALFMLYFCISGYPSFSLSPCDSLPVPVQRQQAFQDAEIGVLFSYDLHVFDGKRYNQTENRVTPIADYNIFHPSHLNTDQWIRAAKAAGATFAILTATHETGFALYQSDVNPYCMKALRWEHGQEDIVRDFVNSCRKYGIKPGIFLGIRWNSFLGVHDFKVMGKGVFQKNRQAYYNKMCEGMVKELCTRYGPLFMFWFDGGASDPDLGAPNVLPIIRKFQPHCIFYHNAQLAEVRWGGSETGTVSYPCWSGFPLPSIDAVKYPVVAQNGNALLKQGDPNGKYYIPAFADIPLRAYHGRHEWFWEPGDASNILPLKNLVSIYYKSVGRNATLILGLTPDTAGVIPPDDVKRLKEFGDTIHLIFSHPLATVAGKGYEFDVHLKKHHSVNQIMIGEDIMKGERIREYRVEAFVDGKWIKICAGTAVGHKRIQVFEPVMTQSLRLIIETAVKEPSILFFKVYEG